MNRDLRHPHTESFQASEPPAQRQDVALALASPASVADVRIPLIGRDRELQQLLEHFYRLIGEGRSNLTTLVGEAGIGKSRLAFELHQWIDQSPDPLLFHAIQVERQMARQPYGLMRQLIAALFRIRDERIPGAGRARIEQGVQHLLGAAQLEKAHFIAHLIGYDCSDSPHIRGVLHDARQLRARATHYTIQCLAALTATTPLVLVIDDIHHADESSLDMIEQMLTAGSHVRAMIVCLAQRRLLDRRPNWGGELSTSQVIELQPLDERDTRRLVAEILRKAGKLPSDLRNLIVSRAEGNPFYTEELIKMLIADGVIVPDANAWQLRVARLSRLRIPTSLSELLRARLQALAPAEREFLLRAAVVGRVFWAGAVLFVNGLGQALGEPPATQALPDLLVSLERSDLIAPQPSSRLPGEREYIFRHELLREVAYQELAPELRRAHHRKVADWLVEHSSDQSAVYAALIAEHLEQARDLLLAGGWYVRAGHYARQTHAVETALLHYRRALALLPAEGVAERIACYEGLGEVQLANARVADATASYVAMADLAEQQGDLAAEARAWNGLAFVQDNAVEPRASQVSAQRAIALAEQAGDQAQQSLGLLRLAWAELRLENVARALELGEQALALSLRINDQALAARCRGLIGVAYEQAGDYPSATVAISAALSHSRATGNLPELATHLNNLGFIANARGHYDQAIVLLHEARQIAQEIGSRVSEIFILSNIGSALNGLGHYAAAEAEMRRGIHLCETNRMVVFSDFYRDLALACLGQGRIDEALEAAQQTIDLARRSENPREVAAAWQALGMAISHLSDSQGAPPCFAESARLYADVGAVVARARTLREWAAHELRAHNLARAATLWDEARAVFSAAGLPHEVERPPFA